MLKKDYDLNGRWEVWEGFCNRFIIEKLLAGTREVMQEGG